ncbi:histidine kinase [Paramagnetospirillum kuznetsovii]|uniref:histidine kinase n=1 Tax=Paramagnetospirillum kuznetsovii TaxID=2053833 RepID=A0A364P197_9PROT|nr:response regulator [Paramagnetospirillum kuznetsovii]RAU23030.1 histidine kinase [Paramagnetospirillum kuznetsovii]
MPVRTKIVTRLTVGFAAVILLTAVMANMAVRTMSSMAEMASDMYAHPFAVTNALMHIRANVNSMRADMLTLMRADSKAEVERIAGMAAAADAEIHADMDIIGRQYLGPQDDVRRLEASLMLWKATRERNILLVREGRADEAIANARQTGAPQYSDLRRNLEEIYKFAWRKASEFNARIEAEREAALTNILMVLVALSALGLLTAQLITRSIAEPLRQLRTCMGRLAEGDLDAEVPNREGRNEMAEMARAVQVFKESAQRLDRQRWIKDGIAHLSSAVQSADTLEQFGRVALDVLAPLTDAGVGLFHVRCDDGDRFEQVAAWGADGKRRSFRPGEGLAGQCAQSTTAILRDQLPDDYIRIGSLLGDASPRAALAVPIAARGRVIAVVELASFSSFTDARRGLVEEAAQVLGLNLEILERNLRTRDLLARTQVQAEELQSSEEELRSQSEALQSANEELRASEEELRMQQEALQAANEELRLKTDALEDRGEALEAARAEADRRAVELDQASRYKSEFLANMSHELRTPLNSLLILSKNLADNEEGNLTEDQVESARVVHESGANLLALINDILDLSKVEAGKMTVAATDIAMEALAASIRRRFLPVAQDKSLDLTIEIAPDLPAQFRGDRGKIEQIINNLVGNALKFTAKGGVTVRLSHPAKSHLAKAVPGADPTLFLALSVTDTGIGIAEADLTRVFRAFEQVDGSSSRQYGGTGLGLTISRQLARLMGGDVSLSSQVGQGSSFTLFVPLTIGAPCKPCAPADVERDIEDVAKRLATMNATADRDAVLLVIEDDPVFRRIVCDLAAKRGFKTISAADGTDGVEMARRNLPTGIVLDIGLPGLDGWGVIEALRRSPETADIPVHVVSASDERLRAHQAGAVGYLAKPVAKEQLEEAFARLVATTPKGRRRILLVDGDPAATDAVIAILGNLDLDILACASGGAALALLQRHKFDGVILDLALPDMNGIDLLERAVAEKMDLPAVIVYSATELSQDETLRIREFTDSIVIRGGRSSDRLVDEVSLFLHSVEAKAAKEAAAPVVPAAANRRLTGRTILVVDDDMRSAFALSKVLRTKGLKVLIAQDGAKALTQLAGQDNIDLVLMDIMMPGMDGYRTMAEIRKQARFAKLPIIALTAKAMEGDKAKCLEAGANDYMAKPVDVERLVSMMMSHIPESANAVAV